MVQLTKASREESEHLLLNLGLLLELYPHGLLLLAYPLKHKSVGLPLAGLLGYQRLLSCSEPLLLVSEPR